MTPFTTTVPSLSLNHPRTLIALSKAEVDAFFPGKLCEQLRALLPKAIWVTDTLQQHGRWPETLRSAQPEIIVSGWTTPSLIGASPASLRYLCHVAGSVRNLISREDINQGLAVTNWGMLHADTVAECALMLTLCALRRTQWWGRELHEHHRWREDFPKTETLFNKRVGLHGFGAVARRLVDLLQPFQVDLVAFSEGVPDQHFIEKGVQRAASLTELFSRADIILEVEALTSRTHHIIGEQLLRSIRPGGVFVNVGRGAVVDEGALVRVAREGQLQVALDVFETEPLAKESPFRGMPNVTLLPHMAGPTHDQYRHCGEIALNNLECYLRGVPLTAVVTSEAYDRST
jgi:phosphoglycerate dehydrogenase-like enzyme